METQDLDEPQPLENEPMLSLVGEFGAIRRWASRLSSGSGVLLGIGDDAALLQALSAPLVTCDALVEDVHFKLSWTSPRDLGWKTLAVSLSDLAAMGACPSAAFLSLAAPPSLELGWLDAFFDGLDECSRRFGCPLAGGDTTRSPGPLFLSLCAVGQGQVLGGALRRDRARVGDLLLATGTLGDSRAGLRLLQEERALQGRHESFLLERHFRPTPRLREIGRVLQQAPDAVTAALDLSDGLAGDAAHIARASKVTLRIEQDKLPLSPALLEIAARLAWDASTEALGGGEDYELLLCVRPERAQEVQAAIESCGTRATMIGQVEPQQEAPVVVQRADGSLVAGQGSWTHF